MSSIGAARQHLKGCGLKRRFRVPILNVARTRKNPAQGGEAPHEGSDPPLGLCTEASPRTPVRAANPKFKEECEV